ncbi:MAG: ATP-dependent DNA helicase, partial [Patescibacteria group bacterium]
ERTRSAFRFLLVDEFQDTNSSQYELIKLLAAPKNNMTIVCDDDQAIFRWRGASFENILSFKSDFPESREVVLTQNYRSPQNILDAAYDFIQLNNPNRLEHRLREQGVSLSKKLESNDPLPGVLEHNHCATLDDEVATVIERMIKLKESGTPPIGGWGDFAILVRSNDAADPFVSACAHAGIPHRFLAQKGLYAKPIIIDLISYFAVLENAHDSPALYRVLTWPLWNVSHAALVELTHAAHKKGCSLWKICVEIDLVPDIEANDREQIRGIVGILQRHGSVSRSARLPLLFLTILKDTGLLASLGSGETTETRENLQYINEFFAKIKTFQEQVPSGRLTDFMTLLSFEQESGDEGSLSNSGEYDPDSVTIMTIHGSKGLEFPYVFLVNMVDQRFPTRERGDGIPLPDALVSAPESASEQPHLEEERRLMYVALTRAQRGVYCFSAEHYGGVRKRKRSQFLSELGFEAPVVSGQGGLAIHGTNGQGGAVVDSRTPQLPLPNSFSFTQLAAFRTCPLQYKFAFLLRIPVFGKPMLSFGKSIHTTLQKFGEQVLERSWKIQQDLFGSKTAEYTENERSLPSREELLSFFEASWIDEWYPSRNIHDEYREKGKKALGLFYDDFSVKKPTVKAIERDFTIKIAARNGLIPIKGRIDRLDQHPEGGVEIVDYKTGRSKIAEKIAFADKEQLLLYQIAAEDIGETVSQLTYHYLEDGSRVSFLGSAQEKDRLKGSISKTLEELR